MTSFRQCGTQGRVYVVAEIGVNHDGNYAKAQRLVDAAAECGVDAVKVQSFSAARLSQPHAPKAAYQVETTGLNGSQFDMLKGLELDAESHIALRDHALSLGLEFFSTPYDNECLDFLVRELQVSIVKIASADVVNTPLLVAAGSSGCDVILSTGMATLPEVRRGVAAVGLGMRDGSAKPIFADLASFDPLTWPWSDFPQRLVVMQCTSQYPTSALDANVTAIGALASATGLPVGYSDHTESAISAVMAVALGAPVIEKHLTLDRFAVGPDHRASLDVESMKKFVEVIREAEQCRGTGVKEPSDGEAANRRAMRRGLYARRAFKKGEIINADDIWMARPADGSSPDYFWDVAGRRAARNIRALDALDPSAVDPGESVASG